MKRSTSVIKQRASVILSAAKDLGSPPRAPVRPILRARSLHAKGMLLFVLILTLPLFAADLRVPPQITAGKSATIGVTGSGTLYISGPGFAAKHEVSDGNFELQPEETRAAGRYLAILKSRDGIVTRDFTIVPDETVKLIFQARPSRVPVARQKVISGSAFVFDQFDNLITKPTPVNFQLTVNGATTLNKNVTSKDGIAWTQTNSSPRAGAAQFIASIGADSVRRVVQQVASDPCGLKMHAQLVGDQLVVETDPVRDCSGNRVPDGTIVTFTAQEANGTRDQVDARVKKGIARATLPSMDAGVITVASGVTLGNQVRIGAAE
ncbi:MAG: hypothetical protein ABI383_12840 [Acidobacteriaceae bacterium]